MIEVFDRMAKLRTYVDDNFSGRDWNLASAMVINNEAGMQMMGDWAKGEFLKAGKVPGVDFVCIRFPGTQGSVTFNSDQFAMFNVSCDEAKAAQAAMAKAIMAPDVPVGLQRGQGLGSGADRRVRTTPSTIAARRAWRTLPRPTPNGKLFGSMAHGHAHRRR